MTKKRVTTDEPEFNNHPIQTDKNRGLRCDKKILKTIEDTAAQAMTNDRVVFIRYDVRMPEGNTDPSNEAFRNGQSNFIKNLKRSGLDPNYVAVREAKEQRQHYHGCLWVKYKQDKSFDEIIEKANESFASAFNAPENKGLVDDCTKDKYGNPQQNGIVLRKDDPDYENKVAKTLEWASYLAKVNQKSNTPPGSRELFSSRLTKNNDKKSI
ncbi:MAG: hypothetical protein WC721_15625 [Victivallaceae bacterium]